MQKATDGQYDLLAKLETRLGHTPVVSRAEIKRYAYPGAGILLGLGLTLAAKYAESDLASLSIAIFGVVVEGCGLAILFKRQVQDLASEIGLSRLGFARQMDEAADLRRKNTEWIRSIPVQDRRFYADFLRRSVVRFEARHALLFGPIEKLGIAPLLAAGFIQALSIFSASRWSFWILIAAAFIVVAYALSLWLVAFKHQLLHYLDVIEMAEGAD